MREGCPVLVSPVLGETGRGIAPDENSRRPVFPKSKKTRTGHPATNIGVRARNSRDLELWILDFLNPFVAGEWLAQGPFLA